MTKRTRTTDQANFAKIVSAKTIFDTPCPVNESIAFKATFFTLVDSPPSLFPTL